MRWLLLILFLSPNIALADNKAFVDHLIKITKERTEQCKFLLYYHPEMDFPYKRVLRDFVWYWIEVAPPEDAFFGSENLKKIAVEVANNIQVDNQKYADGVKKLTQADGDYMTTELAAFYIEQEKKYQAIFDDDADDFPMHIDVPAIRKNIMDCAKAHEVIN